MSVKHIHRNLRYELSKLQTEAFYLENDPLANPLWLKRNKEEQDALVSCSCTLGQVMNDWRSVGAIRKKLAKFKILELPKPPTVKELPKLPNTNRQLSVKEESTLKRKAMKNKTDLK